ncbi:MAG: hypothetical protein K5705_12335 [Oscillospiraceae bacterium]|nr:hypothetical protein [Oscillospiraceae bacterium]
MNQKIKNTARIGYALLVCAVLCAPVSVLAIQSINPDTDETGNAENRVLAEFPSLHLEDGSLNKDITTQFEAWFSEHFGLRGNLVTAYGDLTRNVFSVSTEKDVIIGSDDWLYYTPTIPDATGVRKLSDTEIRHMVHNLELVNSYAASKGTRLIFAPAPNKASIYPEYLPKRYLHTGEKNNLDAFCEELGKTGITLCDWRSGLRDAAVQPGARQLYHKTDTHWNGDGAMLGYQMLMQSAGLDDLGFAQTERTETADWEGDLWKMLSPSRKNPDQNAVYAVPQTYKTRDRMRSIDDLTIQTDCAERDGSLLMFRDSFGRALIPLLAERFASCSFYRASAVPVDQLENEHADFLVYELVERNLEQLIKYAPRMPAPAAELPAEPQPVADISPLQVSMKKDPVYLHCCGLYDPQFSDSEAVFVRLCGADNQQTFEAFRCCEPDILELDTHCANGFSLYIPLAAVPENARIQVIGKTADGFVLLGEAQVETVA